jgi:hypothetical protein
VARGAVFQLVRPTGENKRPRGKHRSEIFIGTPQKKILKDRNEKKIEEKECFYKMRTFDRNSGNK